jgi:uncharacterized membrane protein
MIPPKFRDLVLTGSILLLASVALLVPAVPWPVEWALGIPVLLVVPGYAVVAALLPTPPARAPESTGPPNWPARIALTLVTSVVVVGVAGTGLALRGALQLAPVVAVIGAITILGLVVAGIRRRSLSADRRTLPPGRGGDDGGSRRGGIASVQTLTVILAILALGGTIAFVGANPPPAGTYTEGYLVSPGNASAGPGTAPTFGTTNQSTVEVGLTNRRPTPTTHAVVIELERVGPDGGVLEREELDRFRPRLAPDENAVYERPVSPSLTGDRLRLQILVYGETVPAQPDPETAKLSLRQWVSVPGSGTS